MLRGKVLVIDDDDVRDALRGVLLDEGYEVVLAADGAEGLRYLSENTAPRLILLDWMMGGMDGAECLSAIAANPVLRRTPVVLLTADGRAWERAALLGAVGCLRKPVGLDDLLEMVQRYCG